MTDTPQHTHSYGRAVQEELREPAQALRRHIPDVYEGFKALRDASFADGTLDEKTKQLIALAVSVAQHCDGCMASHARGAARAGASDQEAAEALGVTIQMMGGPGTVYAPRAFAAFREFAEYYRSRE
ncbi:MAG TPA: carboxymuconolactone decarboxylase family protein [Actinomycetes bacterium]|nr:carboxymuconolactone decarboxylase family protein [Actinomycetes bacterium]